MLRLLDNVQDPVSKENFDSIEAEFRKLKITPDTMSFMEFTFTGAGDGISVSHGLKYTPKDVIQTYCTAGESVIWYQDEFDSQKLYLDVSGPLTVRALIGRLK